MINHNETIIVLQYSIETDHFRGNALTRTVTVDTVYSTRLYFSKKANET